MKVNGQSDFIHGLCMMPIRPAAAHLTCDLAMLSPAGGRL